MKKRTRAHIVDTAGTDLLRSVLPKEWVLRNYQPDYGIDFAVETFDIQGDDYLAMGEHFFVQLKSRSSVNRVSKIVHPRLNIEKMPLTLDKDQEKKIEFIPISLEREELELARSMGPAAPLLLMVADTLRSQVHWVCLNDLVDKVILPEYPDFLTQSTQTIYLPMHNQVLNTDRYLIPLRFYARRAKLYAAFNRFRYQRHEIYHAHNNLAGDKYHDIKTSELLRLAKHFLGIILAYDFWQTTYAWQAIETTYMKATKTAQLIEKVINGESLESIVSQLIPNPPDFVRKNDNALAYFLAGEITTTFDHLANLGNIFEEICREWFLPTYLGQLIEENSF